MSSFQRGGDFSGQQQQQVPILVLKEGTTETKGKQAQRNNITAAKLIAELVKSALGPRGMDKMLVSPVGDVTITDDGATILKEVEIEHPAAKMMVEVAKSVDNEVGDGTTSAVVLAGALIDKAEELISKQVHPTVIVDGYQSAAEKAIEILREAAIDTGDDPASNKEWLYKVARTSMLSKLVSGESEQMAKLAVDAVVAAAEKLGGQYKLDADNIKVEKKAGGSLHDTRLVKGLVLDKEVVHGGMPKRIENAKIVLLNAPLEIEKTEMSAEIRISDPQQMQKFLEEEDRMLKSMVDKIKVAGANVVLCQKGIDDTAQHYLAKEGILAVRRVKESDVTKLARATGARIVTNIEDLTSDDLGNAELVEERKVETDKWVFIEGCKNPRSVSILVRGGSQRVVDEAERSVHDAIMAVKDVIEYPHVVAGGGAPEAFVSAKIRDWANSMSGRSQMAIQKFADAIETIPLVLAENAGMNPLDTQVELRSKISGKEIKYGIDVLGAKVADISRLNIYEPLAVKEQVINAATEAASMILRIDEVIAASKPKQSSSEPKSPQYGGGFDEQ
ncbi:archaeal thermosome [Candidatus Nitrososphaera gargensis Ga9.2]|uniref:Archaeal thermosome n=1 Tax=Nitrososphaera gargensis (strain Ga9.2) TaxID=1237085 RepID=K0IHU2_NITGG|nr:thermosome subunit beta [Candidatus Nitrososphaera gargensis]AFU59510.1 archaeal thermosome [Candidatus Nitrososphaera gargensis Ga9.2]